MRILLGQHVIRVGWPAFTDSRASDKPAQGIVEFLISQKRGRP
jgi:hypothetical protein